MKKILAAVGLAMALGAGQAEAALFRVEQTLEDPYNSAFVTPSANNWKVGLKGYDQAQLRLDGIAGTTYEVTFTLLFAESGYTNTLHTPGGTLTEYGAGGTGSVQTGSVTFTALAGTLLPFYFTTATTNSTVLAPIFNTSASNTTNSRSFAISFCPAFPAIDPTCSNPSSGDSGYILLDDSGGGIDDNHDDFVAKFSAKAVSVPDGGTTLALLGLSLIGLSTARRKFGI